MSSPADRPLRVALTVLGCKVNFAEMAELRGQARCRRVRRRPGARDRRRPRAQLMHGHRAGGRHHPTASSPAPPSATPRRTWSSPAAASTPTPARTPPSTRSSPIATRTRSRTTFSRCRDASDPAARCPAACARAPSSRCRTDATIAARTASSGRRAACRRAFRARTVHDRVRAAIDAGHGEIVLCGVDLGSYGRDIGTDLATLLASLLDLCGESARIRLSSVNANDVTSGVDGAQRAPAALLALAHATSERQRPILRAMHRGYRRAQYLRVVRALREVNPSTEFTTDIMVGFPGETEDDHARDPVARRRGWVSPGSRLPLVPAPRNPGGGDRRTGGRCGRAASQCRGAPRHQTLRRACRSPARADACTRSRGTRWRRRAAHGLTAGYHEVVVDGVAGVRQGGLDLVRADGVEGDRLRATLLRS